MRTALWLWVLVAVLRLSYALLAVQIDPFLRRDPLHGDAVVHDRIAWTLVSEGRYVYEKGLQVAPAYIWLMAGVYALVGHAPQAVRFVNALLGLLTLCGLWVMSRRLFGERVANWTLLLTALHPHLLMITGWLYTENLMLPLLVWSIKLCVLGVSVHSAPSSTSSLKMGGDTASLRMGGDTASLRMGGDTQVAPYIGSDPSSSPSLRQRGLMGTVWGWVLVGLLLGLLALTRANFLPFVLLVAGWAGLALARAKGDRRLGWHAVLGILLTACLTVAPYIAYLYARFGHFIPIGLGGYVFLWANNPEADGGFKPGLPETMVVGGKVVQVARAIASPDPVERDRKSLRLAIQWIRENRSAFARLLWLKTRLSLSAFGLQHPGNRRLAMVLRGADWLYWLYLLVALYGFARLWHRREPAIRYLLGLLLLLSGWVWLVIWVYAGGSRPMLPLQPYLSLGFVVGVMEWGALRHRTGSREEG